MDFLDFFWGWWNGLTAWIVFLVHVFGGWDDFPLYDMARSGNWYDLGFLIGVGWPLAGAVGARNADNAEKKREQRDASAER